MEKMEIFKKQKYTETFFKILEQQEKIYGSTLSKKNMEKLLELHLSMCEKENQAWKKQFDKFIEEDYEDEDLLCVRMVLGIITQISGAEEDEVDKTITDTCNYQQLIDHLQINRLKSVIYAKLNNEDSNESNLKDNETQTILIQKKNQETSTKKSSKDIGVQSTVQQVTLRTQKKISIVKQIIQNDTEIKILPKLEETDSLKNQNETRNQAIQVNLEKRFLKKIFFLNKAKILKFEKARSKFKTQNLIRKKFVKIRKEQKREFKVKELQKQVFEISMQNQKLEKANQERMRAYNLLEYHNMHLISQHSTQIAKIEKILEEFTNTDQNQISSQVFKQ